MMSICLITMTLIMFPQMYPFIVVPLVAYINYKPLMLAYETKSAIKSR